MAQTEVLKRVTIKAIFENVLATIILQRPLSAQGQTMIKKVKAEHLKPGMFVHDFGCGWLDHPFLRNRIVLKSNAEVENIFQYHIEDVYIDTDYGIDAEDAPTIQFVSELSQSGLNKANPEPPTNDDSVPLPMEIHRARRLLAESKAQLRILMDAVRLGSKLDLPE